MKLHRRELDRLRLLRLHLRQVIVDTHEAKTRQATTLNRAARRHLLWVVRALLEEQPDRDKLLRNMEKLQVDLRPLLRVALDMLKED